MCQYLDTRRDLAGAWCQGDKAEPCGCLKRLAPVEPLPIGSAIAVIHIQITVDCDGNRTRNRTRWGKAANAATVLLVLMYILVIPKASKSSLGSVATVISTAVKRVQDVT